MKKSLLLPAAAVLFVSACASVMTGMTNMTYQGAPVVLAYSDPQVIADQGRLVTLIVPHGYGLAIDGVPVKEFKGGFNPALRVSQSDNTSAYIVDVLPGAHTLKVTYDGITPGGSNPALKPSAKVGSATISGSYSGPAPFSWQRISETTHTLNGGEVYVVGLKMMTASGEMDLYPVDEKDRGALLETRNQAQF